MGVFTPELEYVKIYYQKIDLHECPTSRVP